MKDSRSCYMLHKRYNHTNKILFRDLAMASSSLLKLYLLSKIIRQYLKYREVHSVNEEEYMKRIHCYFLRYEIALKPKALIPFLDRGISTFLGGHPLRRGHKHARVLCSRVLSMQWTFLS